MVETFFFFKSTKRKTKTKKRDYWPFFFVMDRIWNEWKREVEKEHQEIYMKKKRKKKKKEEDRWRIVSERINLLYLIRRSRR